MKNQEFINRIKSLLFDIEFSYNGKFGAICPFSSDNISVVYDGNDMDCKSVAEVLNSKFIDGKSINDIDAAGGIFDFI
jgi:hypothetical protein